MVSRETQMADYMDLLQRWGRTINLTAHQPTESDWLKRQVETSLALVPYLPPDLHRVTDLGSGQGLPAIPIAITTGLAVDLIEADRRKAAFLTTVLSRLGLTGKVWPTRIEAAQIAPSRCITAQALASLPKLLSLAHPLLQVGGCGLFVKGMTAAAEMATIRSLAGYRAELISLTPQPSYLVKITRLR